MSRTELRAIDERIQELESQIELLLSARKLLANTSDVPSMQNTSQSEAPSLPPRWLPKAGTIMSDVVELLSHFPKGLGSRAILERLNESSRPNLPRTSLSPQLTRLVQRGVLQYKNKKWMLADQQFTLALSGNNRGELMENT